MSETNLSVLVAAISLLAGVAYAGSGGEQSLEPIVVDLGDGVRVLVRASDITSPAALLVFGGLAGRFFNQVAARISTWRPTVIVEHRYPADQAGHGPGDSQ